MLGNRHQPMTSFTIAAGISLPSAIDLLADEFSRSWMASLLLRPGWGWLVHRGLKCVPAWTGEPLKPQRIFQPSSSWNARLFTSLSSFSSVQLIRHTTPLPFSTVYVHLYLFPHIQIAMIITKGEC